MKETIHIYWCDICGKEINGENPQAITGEHLNARQIVLSSLSLEVYYGGTRRSTDICLKCSDAILKMLESLVDSDNLLDVGEKI